MDKKLKILILGPSGSGKSCLANYLAEKPEPIDKNYKPTVGLRILELEKTVCHSRAPAGELWQIQLWDISGDQRYDHCWTAIKHETNGVIIVHNGNHLFSNQQPIFTKTNQLSSFPSAITQFPLFPKIKRFLHLHGNSKRQ